MSHAIWLLVPRQVRLLAGIGLLISAGAACRSPRRSMRVGGDAATVLVTMTSLKDSDHGNKNWVYELSGCVPALNGSLGDHDVVTFSAPGLKKDLPGCQFRVKTVVAPAGVTFASDTEQNVLYFARDLKISDDPTGALVARAGLQVLYDVVPTADASKSFTLKVPVAFPASELATPITAALVCTPLLPNRGQYTAAGDKDGVFSFTVAIDQATDYACTDLDVHVNGVLQKYHGTFAGDTGKLRGLPGQVVQSEKLTLTLQGADTGTDAGGVQVNTKEGEVCKPPKKYDPAKGCT